MINLNNETKALKAVLREVEKDEHYACFDRSYYSDEFWEKEYAGETRQQAFNRSMEWHRSLTLKELLRYYGDRYDYVLEQVNYPIPKNDMKEGV